MLKVTSLRAKWIVAASIVYLMCSSVWANTLESLRVWPSPDETRVVIDVKSEVSFSYFSLSSPDRLVVDLQNTSVKAKLPFIEKNSPVLTKIRKSTPPTKGTTRLVFELKQAAKSELFKLKPTPGGQYGHRLVIDFAHLKKAASKPTKKTQAATKPSTKKVKPKARKDVLIVIDPGHGGEDPGSIGPSRKYEKNATLAISKRLARMINAQPGFRAKLTRSGDYFVNLNRRVAIADENKAHLLVSIHADAFTTPVPRGASVFVLNTRRANSEISRWVQNHERQSELLGGTGTVLIKGQNKNVNQTLLDLQFSHSQKEGYKLATKVLSELSKVARLHNKKPINTSLAVLRSPQIPSILIETGFISNPTEEKQLFQRSHQENLARAITKAIVRYVKANPTEDMRVTSSASNHVSHAESHKVKRGESLSVIASKYGVSLSALKRANNLKSNSLQVGQVLHIPSSSTHAPKATSHKTTSHKTSQHQRTKVISHVVKSGDYLGKIANQYKVSIAAIKRENKLKSNTLPLGKKLKITVAVKNLPTIKHKVSRGEFLGKIANKYGVTVESIRKANRLRSDSLAVGQTLIIPRK